MTKKIELFAKRQGQPNSRPPTQEEWSRILAIPRVNQEDVDASSVEWLHKAPDTVHLRPLQMLSLATIQQYNGLFGLIPVGFGKTLIAWLAPVVLKAKRPVIFMPSNMITAFRNEVNKFRHYFQRNSVDPQLISYSLLSSKRRSRLLEQLKPDLIVCDEAHTLRSEVSSRGERIRRYLREFPDTKCVFLSGTFVDRKLSDLSYMVWACLKENSFIPHLSNEQAFGVWAECVDMEGRPGETHWKAITPLVRGEGLPFDPEAGTEQCRTQVRKAVLSRMASTPGVIMTGEVSSDKPLYASRKLPGLQAPEDILRMIGELEVGGETPDGEDIILDDAQKALLGRTLSLGFYYRWAWERIGGRDEEWIIARKAWHRELRYELQTNRRPDYDSPGLIEERMQRPNPPSHLLPAWEAWKAQKHKPVPPSVAVWVDLFFFKWLAGWLSEQPPCIIWYHSSPVEAALSKMGLETYGSGTSDRPPAGGDRHVACSIDVHGTGKNLQDWSRNIFVEIPSRNKTLEQAIGRTHRAGQEHPVFLHFPQHTGVFTGNLEKALDDAEYTHELSDSRQRLQLIRWED